MRLLYPVSLATCLLLAYYNVRESITWRTSRYDAFNEPRISDTKFNNGSANQPLLRLSELGNQTEIRPLQLDRDSLSNGTITIKHLIDASGEIQSLRRDTSMSHMPEKNINQEKTNTSKESVSVPTSNQTISANATDDESANDSGRHPMRPSKPFNIIILYPDDWRHDTIGAAGKYPVKTPFLDSLAAGGVRFSQNCVTTSVCWISRATLFTGQYLSRHGSNDTVNPVFYQQWNETWPHLLREAGYWTGHIGKWQFTNYTFVEEHFNYTYLLEGYHWWPNPHWQPGEPDMCSTTDIYENQTIDFIKNRPKDRPFALTVAFFAPKAIGHGPDQWFPKNDTLKMYENVTIPEPLLDGNTSFAKLPEFFKETEQTNAGRTRWVDRFGTGRQYQRSMKRYFALITEVDNAIKNIHQELADQGILNETLIIFTTDNGFFLGEHGLGGKWWPYQESIRVPLIISDPRMPKERVGTIDESFTLNIDLAPTILNAANIQVPAGMQGRNIADLYLMPDAKESWRKEFYYEHPNHYGAHFIPASTALVRKDFKYMEYPDWNVTQLFDLVNDPFEYNDIVNHSDYGSLLGELRKRHDELKLHVQQPPPSHR